MGLAAVTIVLVSWFVLARLRLPVRSGLGILALVLVSIPIGARLLNVITKPQYYLENPDQILTRELVGFSLMGGLVLAVAVGLLACRRTGLDPWRLADAFTPGLFVGLAVMRIGCFLAGCCFGVESTVPWAVQFPYGSPAFQRSQGGEADSCLRPVQRRHGSDGPPHGALRAARLPCCCRARRLSPPPSRDARRGVPVRDDRLQPGPARQPLPAGAVRDGRAALPRLSRPVRRTPAHRDDAPPASPGGAANFAQICFHSQSGSAFAASWARISAYNRLKESCAASASP